MTIFARLGVLSLEGGPVVRGLCALWLDRIRPWEHFLSPCGTPWAFTALSHEGSMCHLHGFYFSWDFMGCVMTPCCVSVRLRALSWLSRGTTYSEIRGMHSNGRSRNPLAAVAKGKPSILPQGLP